MSCFEFAERAFNWPVFERPTTFTVFSSYWVITPLDRISLNLIQDFCCHSVSTALSIGGEESNIDAIEASLDAGEDITLVLALKECDDPRLAALLDRCMKEGIDVTLGSENDLWRMAEKSPALALALVGREPVADLDTMLERGGLIWMLAGVQYQTNIGFCIRVAEVSGANGLVVTGEWSSDDRHRINRAAM